jgi:hypothetical protein
LQELCIIDKAIRFKHFLFVDAIIDAKNLKPTGKYEDYKAILGRPDA